MAVVVECPNCRCRCPVPPGPARARIKCPSCESTFTFTRTKSATLAPLAASPRGGTLTVPAVQKVRRRGHVIRLRCPHCESLVDLCRRQKRKSSKRIKRLAGAPVAVPAAAPTEFDERGTTVEEPHPLAPPPPVRPQPIIRPMRRPLRDRDEERALRPEWVISIAVIVTSGALIAAVIPGVPFLVLPLAAVGLAIAAYGILVTLRSGASVNFAAGALAYGFLVLVVTGAFPGCLGPRYFDYRQPALSVDVVRAVPRQGVPATEKPADINAADASRFALERNGVLIEVLWARLGPADAQSGSGKIRAAKTPILVVAVRRRQAGDIGNHREKASELKFKLSDEQGHEFERLEVDLATGTSGPVKFPVAVHDELVTFAAPSGAFDRLFLEAAGAELGTVRFAIPSMMVARPEVKR
jgi:hypothetical protein